MLQGQRIFLHLDDIQHQVLHGCISYDNWMSLTYLNHYVFAA